jgi:hypothetical protein
MSIGAKIFYKPYIIVLKFGLYWIWSLSGVIQMPNQVGYGKLIYISPKGGKTSTHQNKSCYVTIRITNRCDFFFVLCLYFLFLVFSLHVSGFHKPIIRGISSCCFYATIWFMQCFVDRLRASADWFVVVTSVY